MSVWDVMLRAAQGRQETEVPVSGFPWDAIGRSHRAMLAQVPRQDAAEEEARVSRAEALAYQSRATAEEYRELYEAQQAHALAAHEVACRAEAAQRAERLAQAEDYRDHLLASGQGRWRTVAEVLRDARGVPPDARGEP